MDDDQALSLDAAARARLVSAWTGGPESDLDVAVDLWRQAREITTRSDVRSNLGVALRALWERDRDRAVLDEAVAAGESAVAAGPPGERVGANARLQLGKTLRARFAAYHDSNDLDAAVAVLEQVDRGQLSEADVAEWHEYLGNSLYDRHDHVAAVEHLTRAAELVRADDEAAPGYWSNLASALLDRFETSGDPAQLDEAIRRLEAGLAASRGAEDSSSDLLSNLGNAWRLKAEVDGDIEAAEHAIALLVRAIDTETSAERWRGKLSNLAGGLLQRFDMTGRVEDVDDAIDVLEQALEATPANDPARPSRLNNLGIALRTRQLRRRSGREDIDRAVAAFDEALVAADDDEAVVYHANLGNALHQHYDVTGEPASLERAVRELELALAATPPASADRPGFLNNLGATLSARGGPEDSERALALSREAVRLAPTASAQRPTFLINLANAASERDDVGTAREAYRDAVESGLLVSPADALHAARNWSEWARDRGAWDEVVEAHAGGERAARTLFGTQLRRADKESWLRDAEGLMADGAYALVARSRPREAVAALERGRALLLSERLERDDADLDRLPEQHARRFRAAAARVRAAEARLPA